jgi:hypothetical protein
MLKVIKDTTSFEGHERILESIRTGKIVYFINSFEEVALKYIPGEYGKLGKYFAKYYGCDEYETVYWSKVVCEGELEGRIIKKSKYDDYHLLDSYLKERILKLS